MANVLFKRGVQAQLPQNGAIDGAFYLTTDTHRLYYGNSSGTCDLLSQAIIEVATVSDLANQPLAEGQFYYVTGSNILAIRHNNAWVQINPDTKVVATNGTSNTAFSTASNGTVTLTIAQNRADGAVQSDVTASFQILGDDNVSVSTDGSTITISGELLDVAEYTEEVNNSPVHKGASIVLGESQVDLKEGNNISITASGDAITIAGTDNYVTGGQQSVDVRNGGGWDIGATLNRSGSLGVATVQSASIDPVINYGYDTDENEQPITTASAHFINGAATLNVYTKAEVDHLVDTSLYELNAMTYKGTVGPSPNTVQSLPTTDVRIGDTYLAAEPVNVGGTVYPTGTMFVANGDEENGVITDNLVWNAVQTSDTDTKYRGLAAAVAADSDNNKTGGGKLDIVEDTLEQAVVGTIKVEGGVNASSVGDASIIVTSTAANSNKESDIVVAHKLYSPTTSTTEQTAAAPGANTSITFVSNITESNGHVASIEKKTVSITNTVTNVSNVTMTAAGISGQDNGATVTTSVTTADVGGTVTATQTGSMTINSSSLAVSGSSSAVVVNLEWGSFPSNS